MSQPPQNRLIPGPFRDARFWKRLWRWTAAIVLILVGLVLIVPGVPGPGLLLIVVALFILMPESRWLRRQYATLKRRYPRIFQRIDHVRARGRRGRHRRGAR